MSIGDSEVINYPPKSTRRKIFLGGIIIFCLIIFIVSLLWLSNRSAEPREAPESEIVLNAQMEMPFQVLIPAFLPGSFLREKVQVNMDNVGPQGGPVVRLVYPTRHGEYLTFYEWLPSAQGTQASSGSCRGVCMSQAYCTSVEMGFSVGSPRVMAEVSAPNILSIEEARSVIDTLGPAVNRQIFTSFKDEPVTYSVPPAVDVPLNADGGQEVTLVVTPNGYSPEHFAVQKGVPVILTFRQIGQVGCGNELIFQWGDGKNATISLASPSDSQTLEFTPAA